MRIKVAFLFIVFASALFLTQVLGTPKPTTGLAKVTLMRTPNGGIQPQAAVDKRGVLHLVYFKGKPEAGNIFYVRREPGSEGFSNPISINSAPDSALAIGSVRGAQLAVGKGARIHVAWLGSGKARPKGPSGATPMLYARLNDDGTAFEPQRNVMQFAVGLDGGGSVAADPAGNVYVAWHAGAGARGEVSRRVWVAGSRDEGRTFDREQPAIEDPTGACGCCGMRAFADDRGSLYILYRAARESVHRDMYLLVSKDAGMKFRGSDIAKWELNACPMSTASINEGGSGVLLSWETAGQVFYADVDPATFNVSASVPAPGGGGDRKHPAVIGNGRGETLLAWTEGTAWNRGGALAWQVFDKDGHPTEEKGRAEGVPVWGLVTAFARPDGGFTIIY